MKDQLMNMPDSTSQFVLLVGEKNAERFQKEITDIMIEQFRSDIEDNMQFIIDFQTLFWEIEDIVREDIKEKMIKVYSERCEKKLSEWLGEN